MIGNLTIDKASMNISYFLNTIRLISINGGKISRADFVQQMADFIGVPAKKNGKENRTPYNKSKLPRYFGFVDIESADDGTNYLVLTHRGEQLAEFIGENKDADAAQRFFILPEHRESFIDLIFESVIFGSFGKNNCGAEQSNTDVEPPKVVFKTLLELERATAEEICYVMFGLNRGEFQTFDEAINKIKENRAVFQYDYAQIMEQWEVTNIVHDCKIINIFTDDSIQLLRSERDDEIGKVFYYLNDTLSAYHRDQIATLSAIYQPLKLFVYTDGNSPTVQEWVNTAILGGVSDNSYVYRYDGTAPFLGGTTDGSYSPGIFEQALLKALQNGKKNIYLLIENTTEPEFVSLFGDYYSLLHRIDNLSSEKHGWSEQAIDALSVYQHLVSSDPSIRGKLQYGKLEIPSNLQIVGTIIMDNIIGNEQFDYEFTRCLVKTGKASDSTATADEKAGLKIGTNILFYGVPGCGKSHLIKKDYCNNDDYMERVVFHPEFSNTDFIGQILPKTTPEGHITYDFEPGPFSKILKRAWEDSSNNYYLVIEEINRGNAPAIFGETFQLLDRLDGESEYGISNENISKYVYGDKHKKVKIPSNLFILATMNTADQNVFTLDTAFKRRWYMKNVPNDFSKCKYATDGICGTQITWESFAKAINDKIIDLSKESIGNEDMRLGAFFVKKEELCESGVFAEKVLMYLWNDAFKYDHEKVFADDILSFDNLLEEFTSERRFGVFKSDLNFVVKKEAENMEHNESEATKNA